MVVEYDSLDKNVFLSILYVVYRATTNWGLNINLCITICTGRKSVFIVQMTSIALVIVNSRYMLLFLLQATNRIRIYAKYNAG